MLTLFCIWQHLCVHFLSPPYQDILSEKASTEENTSEISSNTNQNVSFMIGVTDLTEIFTYILTFLSTCNFYRNSI